MKKFTNPKCATQYFFTVAIYPHDNFPDQEIDQEIPAPPKSPLLFQCSPLSHERTSMLSPIITE